MSNHKSMLSRIINAFSQSHPDASGNPELASAINDAKSALKKETSGSGSIEPGREHRDISEKVNRISMHGGAVRVVLKQGDTPEMLLECSRASNLSYVLTKVVGDTLAISLKPVTFVFGNGSSVSQINTGAGSIQIGNMSVVKVNGQIIVGNSINCGPMNYSSNFDSDGNFTSCKNGLGSQVIESDGPYLAVITITLPNVSSIDISGSADVEYQKFKLEELSVDIQGSGDVLLSGSANVFESEISGSGSIKATGLMAKSAKLRVSGSGNIKLSVEDAIKAKISGSGEIKIHGNPPIRDVKVSGSGEIKFKPPAIRKMEVAEPTPAQDEDGDGHFSSPSP